MGTEGGGGVGLPVGPHLAAQLLDLSQTTLGPSSCAGRVREDGLGGGGLERLTRAVSLQLSVHPKQEVAPKCRIPISDSR